LAGRQNSKEKIFNGICHKRSIEQKAQDLMGEDKEKGKRARSPLSSLILKGHVTWKTKACKGLSAIFQKWGVQVEKTISRTAFGFGVCSILPDRLRKSGENRGRGQADGGSRL
jgi:hypothetical protein